MTIYEAHYAVEDIADDTELVPEFREALDAWRALRGEAELPPWSVLHFLAFPSKLLSLAVFAAFDEAAGGFRIRYWGSHRYDLHGQDHTGRLVAEVGPPCVGEKLAGEYAAVRQARRPLKLHSYFKSRSQGDIHLYKLRLPFTIGGTSVDGILTLDDPDQLTRRFFLANAGTPPVWAREDRSGGEGVQA